MGRVRPLQRVIIVSFSLACICLWVFLQRNRLPHIHRRRGANRGGQESVAQDEDPVLPAAVDSVPTRHLTHANPIVKIQMQSGGTIKMELLPSVAPNTVNNFIALGKERYYDNTEFHRVIPNFIIQGGQGRRLNYTIKGEFKANGFENTVKHTRGVVSMARTHDRNSASAQFFIVLANSPHLDGAYAAFGRVLQGLDVADQIANQPKGRGDRPLKRQVMKRVEVSLLGLHYDPPEKVPKKPP